MILRITAQVEGDVKVLKLDGNLTHEEIPVLYALVEANGIPLRLDLTHLLLADRDGLAALRHLRQSGALLQGLSPYFELLIDDGQAPRG